MKAVIEKQLEVIRNNSRRCGDSDMIFFVNSRIVTIRLFGIPIYRKIESIKD